MNQDSIEFTRHLLFWHISYAECLSTGGEYPLLPSEKELQSLARSPDLYQINQSVLSMMQGMYPGLPWSYGLKPQDFIQNARATVLASHLKEIQELDTSIEENLKALERTCGHPINNPQNPDFLPLELGPLLIGQYRHLKWPQIECQIASEGHLKILRRDLTWEQLVSLRNRLVVKIEEKLFLKIQIRMPNEKSSIGELNQELVYLACVSWADALVRLNNLLLDHLDRGLLQLTQKSKSVYSVKRSLSDLHSILQYVKNWIQYQLSVNQPDLDFVGVIKLKEAGHKILKILEGCVYLEDKVLTELRLNPSCLTDAVAWYNDNYPEPIRLQQGYESIRNRLVQVGWKL